MIYGFWKWPHKFYSVFSAISKSKTMNLNKCYFRHIQNEEKVDISFLLKVKDSVRQFNFSRKPSETLESLLARIGTNVQKAVDKANKKKGKSDKSEIDITFYDVLNKPIPKSSTCQELFDLQGPLKLQIYDHVYEAVFNVPWVVSINLPQSILAGFPIYPENLVMQYADKKVTVFNWYKGLTVNESGNTISDNHVKWELIGSGFSYTPSADDIGAKIKLECVPGFDDAWPEHAQDRDGWRIKGEAFAQKWDEIGNENATGPAVEAVSKNLVEAGPGTCPFETRHMFTMSKLNGKSFRCVSYNILADLYADSDFTRTVLHPYCPPYALHIDYRKQLIVKELLGYNADIVCLQEVDRKIFYSCLQPNLGSDGLEGVFHKKGKEVAEGLACFYRKDRFGILKSHSIVLAEALKTESCLEPIWNAIKYNKPLLERLLDRSTVASATFLQSQDDPNQLFIVGNTHLYFHPDADHIRLLQGGIVIYWLRDIRNKLLKENPDKRVSLMLCGDFNSVPSCGVYQLYTTGLSPKTLPDWSSNENEAVSGLDLEQDITLGSACGTPPFTNYTAGFADCLDYIYYDKNNLEVEQVVPFPSDEELRAHTALPSIVFPSDHIALIADLRIL